MRTLLTLVAVALVTLLTAALIVPYLIDWSAHRADIAERLEAMTGGRVTLTGPVTLRLLPTPYLEVGAGSAALPGPDAPRLAFEGARLELALVKLASGAFRFNDVRLMKPVLTLTRAVDGALVLPASASTPSDAVGADRFSVRDGVIRIVARGDAPEWTIPGVELDGDAPTLAGPYHMTGRASGPDRAPIVFRFASEKAGPAGAPVRIAVDAGPAWPALEFDGRLARLDANGPAALGAVVLTGTSPGLDEATPWRVTGNLAADLDGATLTGAEFRFGPEERALRVEGSARLAFRGAARLAIEAKARQANVDGLLRRKGEDAVPPSRAFAALSAALGPALDDARAARLDVHVAVETAILGGDTLSGLSATLQAKPGAPPAVRVELGLPGQSRIKAEGEVEAGPKFTGAIDFATADPGALGRWAGQGAPELTAWTDALDEMVPASSSLSVSGEVEAAALGVSGKALRIALGRSVLSGALAVTRPAGTKSGRITADLAADSLDLDTLPSLEAARSLIGDYDLSLSLDAKALSLAHVGDAAIEGASLALKVGRTGERLTLDRLAVSGLGGASVEATGAAGPDGVRAAGRLDAERLADFATLVSRLAPGPWTRALVQRAPLLSPASIAFEARGGALSDGAPSLLALKATGTLAATKAALSLDPAGKGEGQTLSLVLDAPDSGALMRQLGLGAPATVSAAPARAGREKPGRLSLSASGAWGSGFDFDANASLAGAALSGRGRYAPTAEGDDARLFGALKVGGDDVAPFAALIGLAPGGGPIGPINASADVTLRGARWNVSRISGDVAGVKASGALAYEPAAEGAERVASPDLQRAQDAVDGPAGAQPAAPPALTGDLSFDRLRFADLASLSLGPPQPASAGKVWPEAKFAAPTLIPPAAAVRVHVGTLNLTDALAAQAFSTGLRFDRGRLDLDDVAMRVDGGAVSGRATLRRSGETVTIDGALAVEPVPVTRPGLSGRIGGRLDFASTGRSAAALIAGLAGGGTAEFAGATLAHSDPAALERVVVAAQASEAAIDETNVAFEFAAALDKGGLAIPDGPAPLALSAGTIKVGPIVLSSPRGAATLNASLDLARRALETRLALVVPATGLKFWSGPNPSAIVTVEDALDAPKRRIDVAGLAAGLATQAIARESDRIAALESDIRERAFFNRRLKGERFLDRRNAEIEDWRVEQERMKGLAEHLAAQRAEDARLAAEKAAAEKAAASQERPPEAPEKASDLPGPPRGAASTGSDDGAAGLPAPPPRPRPRPPAAQTAPPAEPTAGGLY